MSSGLQAIAIQVLGVGFFYIISLYLTKDAFGVISWANAVAMTLTTLLSLGLEQVVIRRIAVSKDSNWPSVAFLVHALVTSTATALVLLVAAWLSPPESMTPILFLLFLAQALLFIAAPVKQYLNGRERFAPYGVIALCSNGLKLLLAWYATWSGHLSVYAVAWILTGCAGLELVALLVYVRVKEHYPFRFHRRAYSKLVRESLPQYLSVIFDVGLSRMDWILLGILSTRAVTADYSFAYRAFEISKLPLLVIGTVILPRFSRILQRGLPASGFRTEWQQLFELEMFGSVCIPLVLNLIWAPGVDAITMGKYGTSNATEFLLLSVCLPLHFGINFFWTLAFAARKYRQATTITIIASAVNVLLNLALIPFYGGIGAAIAFLGASLVQFTCYALLVRRKLFIIPVTSLPVFALTGAGCYVLAWWISPNLWVRLAVALGGYFAFSLLLRRIRPVHFRVLMAYLKK